VSAKCSISIAFART